MNEKQVTELAVRYLHEVHEALKVALQQDMVSEENINSALHCVEWSRKHAEKLVQNQELIADRRERLFAVRDAMLWLIILFGQKGELLKKTGMPVPTLSDVQVAHLGASHFPSA